MIVGLTGATYSKVDFIAKEFKSVGVPVFDGDTYIKYLLQYHNPTKDNLTLEFDEPFTRVRLKKILNNGKLFKMCIKHIQDDVFTKLNEWRLKQNYDWVIFKSYLIYEMNWQENFKYVISSYSDRAVRHERRGDWEPGLPNFFYEYDSKVKRDKANFSIPTDKGDSDITRSVNNYKIYLDSVNLRHLKNN